MSGKRLSPTRRKAVEHVKEKFGISERHACRAVRLSHYVWSYDFAMDSTEHGRRLKIILLVDGYTRECLSLEGQRSIKACWVVGTLCRLFVERGNRITLARITALSSSQRRSRSGSGGLRSETTLYIELGAPR